MDAKQVESLAETISTLSSEDYSLLNYDRKDIQKDAWLVVVMLGCAILVSLCGL